MPQGYLVSLGNNSLDSGDAISGGLIDFTTSRTLGAGQWVWNGTAGTTTYTNQTEPGVYYLATNGNVYFVPDFGPVTTISSAQALNPPAYIESDGTISGTGGDDLIDESYANDPQGDTATGSNDTIQAGAGNDTIFAGKGNDSIDAGTGNDTVNAGDNNDTIFGGAGDDSISGDAGNDSIQGGEGNDIIRGDTITTPDRIAWEWSKMPDPDDASGIDEDDALVNGVQQIVGGVGITYTYRANPAGTTDGTGGTDTAPIFNGVTTNTAGIDDGNQTINANSSAHFGGDLATSEIELAFDRAVTNVEFNINDIDSNIGVANPPGIFNDRASVFAYDAAGNAIPVTIVFGSALTQSNTDGVAGNETGTNTTTGTSGADPTATMNVSIAGPVARIVIRYQDTGTTGDDGLIEVTDVYFDEPFDPKGNDNIDGGAGNDIIFGDAGNDTLQGGTGTDSIYGGTGNDRIADSGTDADYIDAGDGDDSVTAGTGADLVYGGAGNDNLRGEGGNDEVYGGIGNDTVDGDGGSDTLYGDAGNDSLIGDSGNDTIFGGTGDDNAVGGIGNDSMYGGDGNDSLFGNDGDDIIEGGIGNDYLDGDAGNDSIAGGAGNDVIVGDSGNDSLYGGTGDDGIYASDGDNIAQGGAGNDSIFMGTGNDTIDGGTGNDSVVGGGANDTIVLTNGFGIDNIDGSEDIGDTDVDVLDASAVTSNVTVDLSTLSPADNERGTLTDGTNTATFNNIENIRLGSGDDSVTGSSGDDSITTGSGADTINMGAGNDTVDLGSGSPDGAGDLIILQDGFGDDVITNFDAPTPNPDGTFNGIDMLDVSNLFDLPVGDPGRSPVQTNDVAVSDDGSGNAVLTFPNGESITLVGISPTLATNPYYLNAIGIPMSDGTVSGTSGNDQIDGGYSGDPDGDVVDGNDAILPGDSGNDDLIEAGAGNDTILAGDGNDEIYGDTLSVDPSALASTTGGSAITIDITNLADDTIELWWIDASGTPQFYQSIPVGSTVSQGTFAGHNWVLRDTSGQYLEVYTPTSNTSYTYGPNLSDSIDGGAGNDTIFAQFGDDTVQAGSGNDVVDAGTGNDTVYGGAGDDGIGGGDGDDAIYGDDGNDNIGGDAGNDTLFGGAGDDVQSGGDGDDVFVLENGMGNDTITGGETGETTGDILDASALTGNSTLNLSGVQPGNPEAGTLTSGFNTVNFEEIETIILGSGNDTVFGSSGSDRVVTGTGADRVTAGAGNDFIDLGNGSADGAIDIMTLQNGFGDDIITSFDAPTPDGDGTFTGIDRLNVSNLFGLDGQPVTVRDVTVTDDGSGNAVLTFPSGDSITLVGISATDANNIYFLNAIGIPMPDGTVSGTSGDDTIDASYTGDNDDDVVDGNDSLLPGDTGNDDLIYGFAGNDTIASGDGNDEVYGGSGNDTITDNGGPASDDLIYGGLGDDSIDAGQGDDDLGGGLGDDTLSGGAGNDTLTGGAGADNLQGGDGNDTLIGDDADITAVTGVENVSWTAQGPSGTNLENTFVQDTGGMTVTVATEDAGSLTSATVTTITQYVATGEPYSTTSALSLSGGSGPTSTTTLDFEAQPDTGLSDEVTGVSFRINDIDQGSWQDIVTINAYDADGNLVPVTITLATTGTPTSDTVSGNTITAGNQGDSQTSPDGSALIEIAGPVQSVEIIYDNGSTGGQALYVTDVYFTTQAATADDAPGAADTLEGGAGDDTIFGGEGSDRIILNDGFGTDITDGGEDVGDTDIDVLDASGMTANTTLDLSGADPESGTLTDGTNTNTFTNIETVTLGSGDDSITGSDGDDSVTAGTGADTINMGTGNDTVDLGAGSPDGDADEIVLQNGFGDDTVTSFDAPTPATGSTFTGIDTLDVTNLFDLGGRPVNTDDVTVTDDGSGNAVLTFPSGDSITLIGIPAADANDPFYLNAIGIPMPDGTVEGTAGNDVIDGAYNGDPDGDIVDGNDAILPGDTGNDDLIYGFAGNDSIIAGDGNDEIYGGTGSDQISGGSGDDELYGGAGNDTLIAGNNTGVGDQLFGGTGDDTLTDSFWNATLDGGDGQDLFNVGYGAATIFGGEGGVDNDTLSFAVADDTVAITLDGNESGTYADNDGDSGTFSGIENYILTSGDDTFNGAAATTESSSVFAGAGNDTLVGGDGDDTLEGGAGNDQITGGAGSDTIEGGAGNDTLTFSEGDSVDGGDGDDTFVLQDLGEPTNGIITIVGGDNGETPDDNNPATLEGDTLQLGTLADLSTLIKVSDGINASGNETFSGSVVLDDGTLLEFSQIENIICFTPGTLIATPRGARDIASLRVGDLVVTRDHGLQPIRWIQSRTVPATGRFAPVRIRPGVVTGLERDILVSPQHRMLFQGYRAELLFGESEVLIAAKHLIDGRDVTQDEGGFVTYIHMMFDEHEIVYADGCASESFHPGSVGLSAVSDPAREELFALFPALRSNPNGYGATARRCLKRHEADLIR